jgi:hypothetical protein
MKSIAMSCVLLMLGGLPWIAASVRADEGAALQSEAQQTDALGVRHRATRVEARLASQFGAFAGSEANAQNLVKGLRTGTAITLMPGPDGANAATTSLTFDPPTRPMGYGNVFISLALAEQQLANLGVTNPTPQQIEAALVGGTITAGTGTTTQVVESPGILTLRSEGMGWGNIAKAQGMNLGHVVSGKKSANHLATTSVEAGTTSAAVETGAQSQGATNKAAGGTNVTTASGGGPQGPAHGASGRNTRGIVTAAGTGARAAAGVNANARARGAGAGIVTGSGAAVNTRGGGAAKGEAKGLLKH